MLIDPIIKVTKEERVNKPGGCINRNYPKAREKTDLKNQQEQSFGLFECVIEVQKKREGYWG